MSDKYRVKLKNGRIIGPFSDEEIGELYKNGRIDGKELCQHFPIGDWLPLNEFKNISEKTGIKIY